MFIRVHLWLKTSNPFTPLIVAGILICVSLTLERFTFMSFRRLALIGALIITFPALAFAQIGEPIVVPWSADNTPAQSQIRQYQNFKRLQNDQAVRKPPRQEYAYQAPRDEALPIDEMDRPRPIAYMPQAFMVEEPSALEAMYSERIVDELEQFGYDMFGVPDESLRHNLAAAAETAPSIPSGAVQDDFILNAGDELEILFTGQRSEQIRTVVNSQGQILIPDFPPIPAAGRSIGHVRVSIEAASEQLHNTQAFVSLTSVRQIGVLVVGHVKRPGRKTLTVFHTVLDALMESGGVKKTGSLRQIKLVRGGRSTFIDLYGLLLHGSTNMDLGLRDGDRLIIPPIGPTVAVAGEAKRAGIFEILPRVRAMYHQPENNSEKLTLNEMLELSGGVLSPGKNRFLHLAVSPSGKEIVREVHNNNKAAFNPVFSDGSVLMVSKGREKRAGTVNLVGNTLRPGLHDLSHNKTLSALLSSPDILGEDIYPLIGVIERWDEKQLTKTLIDFPLKLVLQGAFDRSLEDSDAVHLFSNAQIKSLRAPKDIKIRNVSYGSEAELETDMITDETLASFLRERSVFTRGAIRDPGAYPISEGLSLESVLATAGGLALEADTSNIEVSSLNTRTRVNFRETNPNDVVIDAGDTIRVNQKFAKITDNSVLVIGEVSNPGRYDLMPGDKISDLMQRAGGLTQQAYPYGAIFSRESERRAEEARFRAQASQVELAVSAALEADDKSVNAGKIAEARSLASELRNAEGVGRITVEADPAVLTTQPELDMLLESGDRLYIPKRNLLVRVRGEVLSPASLQFRERKDPLHYIHEAGGFTFHADKDRTFVIYPDGSAQPLQVSAWNHKPVKIPPGSTIVIPRDPKPFDFIQSAKDVSQILSNLAVTAIFVDDLQDD